MSNRRNFIKKAGILSAFLALNPWKAEEFSFYFGYQYFLWSEYLFSWCSKRDFSLSSDRKKPTNYSFPVCFLVRGQYDLSLSKFLGRGIGRYFNVLSLPFLLEGRKLDSPSSLSRCLCCAGLCLLRLRSAMGKLFFLLKDDPCF